MFARLKLLRSNESGAAILEFTVVVMVFLLVLFGTVEFSYLFYQWNAATKAVQFGARLAAVSDPVSDNLTQAGMSGLSSTVLPGDPMPPFNCVCDGSGAGACTGSVPPGASACHYNATAMNVLVYGRGNGTACTGTGANIGMCNLFSRITPQNVVVRYQNTGLGYAGRPGGPVPTITVSLNNSLAFQYIFLNGLVPGLSSTTLSSFQTTITGEDLGNGV